jgi:hypothetical protein
MHLMMEHITGKYGEPIQAGAIPMVRGLTQGASRYLLNLVQVQVIQHRLVLAVQLQNQVLAVQPPVLDQVLALQAGLVQVLLPVPVRADQAAAHHLVQDQVLHLVQDQVLLQAQVLVLAGLVQVLHLVQDLLNTFILMMLL